MKYLLAAIFVLASSGTGLAVQADDSFTIFLVRHAEKASISADRDDPGLSGCGKERARRIAAMVSDAGIERVFSTDYERTRATAKPLATALSLEIDLYDPRKLEEFSEQLLEAQENSLVVGHSNTTGVLAGMLSSGEQEEFSEEFYDRLYLVAVNNGEPHMLLLHQGFQCGD